jgi:hypothetical protein
MFFLPYTVYGILQILLPQLIVMLLGPILQIYKYILIGKNCVEKG